MEFNKKFKEFLDTKGVKAIEAGQLMGYSASMMSRYVNAAKPHIEFIDRLVKLYPDADLNWLLKDEEQLITVEEQRASYKETSALIIEDIERKLIDLKIYMSQK